MRTFRIFILLFFAAFSLSVLAAAAPVATLTDLKGKVEVMGKSGTWEKAEKGMIISPEQTISTGFNSWAVISLGASNVRIEPVSRLTLDQLADKGTTVKTDLYLRVGKVKAEVKSTDGKKNDFSVASPYSTASVRGTSWTQSLRRVSVHEGTVAVRVGAPRRPSLSTGAPTEQEAPESPEADDETLIQRGQYLDLPSSPSTTPLGGSAPVPQSGDSSDNDSSDQESPGSGSGQPPSNRGSLNIEWFW